MKRQSLENILFFLFFVLPAVLTAQGERNIWYFGRNAGLDFGAGDPALLADGRTDRGVSTVVSDAGGRLLFYTDGRTVWDRRHQVMPLGEGLRADPDSPQSVAVVPVVNAPGQYYLFTVSPLRDGGVLRYSIVDLNRNGGFGAIVPDRHDVVLREGVYPVLLTTPAECGVWLITSDWIRSNVSVFVAYLIDFRGIDFPLLTSHGVLGRGNQGLQRLILKLSPDQKWLFLAATYEDNRGSGPIVDDYIYAFGFIREEGRVVQRGSLDVAGFQDVLGMAVSPGNNFLYTNERDQAGRRNIFQYDLRAGDAPAIAATRILVGSPTAGCVDCLGDLAVAPDRLIYVARDGQAALGVITEPERPGAGSGYIDEGPPLGNGRSRRGLPNGYTPVFQVGQPLLLRDTLMCRGGALLLTAAPGFDRYRWPDGSTGPTFTARGPQQVRLEAFFRGCVILDTVDIRGRIDIDGLLGPDTMLCPGGRLLLDATTAGGSDYRWSDGLRGATRTIDATGQYWLEYFNGECPVRDSLLIGFHPDLTPRLGPDTVLCPGETLLLSTDISARGYRWSDGSGGFSLPVAAPGAYWLELTSAGNCRFRDTVVVRYAELPVVDLGGDRGACEGTTLTLQMTAPAGGQVRWQDGSRNSTLPVSRSGVYSVEVSNGRCRAVDEVTITFRDCCTLFIPNVFSPNDDGVNDEFRVFAGCPLASFRMRLFSRLGQLLFDSADPAAGWDGRFGAGQAPAGVYLYLLEYGFESNGEVTLRQEQGGFNLIR